VEARVAERGRDRLAGDGGRMHPRRSRPATAWAPTARIATASGPAISLRDAARQALDGIDRPVTLARDMRELRLRPRRR
jgi:hypothetical protein